MNDFKRKSGNQWSLGPLIAMKILLQKYKTNFKEFYLNKINVALLVVSLVSFVTAQIFLYFNSIKAHGYFFFVAWVCLVVLIFRGWFFQIKKLFKQE